MSHPHDEPLGELRRAWKELEAPLPAQEREDLDPTTRAAVEWMRDAWAGVEVPAPVLPERPRLRLLPRLAHDWRTGVAAAALLFALLFAWRVPLETGPSTPNAGRIARAPETTPPDAPEPTPRTTPIVQSIGENHIELRSGPVTLVIVTPDTGG